MRKMTPTRPRRSGLPATSRFTVGRAGFAQISAVEGITLTPDMQAAFADFDRDGLTAEQRRRAIVLRFKPAR
jgi:hypothetical protein